MSDAARPDPAAAAQRVKDGVKDLARGALGAAGDLAADLAEGYRRSTRYFKLRAAVVGSWAVLSVATVWAACPSSGPSNALGAKGRLLSRHEPGILTETQISVENESSEVWKDVVLTVEGGWSYARRTVRPQDRVVVSIGQFRKGDERAPADLEPRTVTVECEGGRVTTPLAR